MVHHGFVHGPESAKHMPPEWEQRLPSERDHKTRREYAGDKMPRRAQETVMRSLALLALTLMLAACETVQTTQPGMVGVNRQQTMLVSDQEITQASAQEYRKVIADAQAKGTLDRNASYVQ